MTGCPTSLYKRVAKIRRVAGNEGRQADLAREAERAVRGGLCNAGRRLLRASLKEIRKELRARGYYD